MTTVWHAIMSFLRSNFLFFVPSFYMIAYFSWERRERRRRQEEEKRAIKAWNKIAEDYDVEKLSFPVSPKERKQFQQQAERTRKELENM